MSKQRRPKLAMRYPDITERQIKIFEAIPDLRRDFHEVMEETGYNHNIWDRHYGEFLRIGNLPTMRQDVWVRLRARGWSLNDIAFATCTACHTTILTAIRKATAQEVPA